VADNKNATGLESRGADTKGWVTAALLTYCQKQHRRFSFSQPCVVRIVDGLGCCVRYSEKLSATQLSSGEVREDRHLLCFAEVVEGPRTGSCTWKTEPCGNEDRNRLQQKQYLLPAEKETHWPFKCDCQVLETRVLIPSHHTEPGNNLIRSSDRQGLRHLRHQPPPLQLQAVKETAQTGFSQWIALQRGHGQVWAGRYYGDTSME